jgi:hypothetical protein
VVMVAEAVAASTAVVAEAVFMAEAVAASTAVVATEAGITARPAAAAMAAVGTAARTAAAGITIPCLPAAHIPPGALATLTAQPATEDTRRATVATVQQAVVRA